MDGDDAPPAAASGGAPPPPAASADAPSAPATAAPDDNPTPPAAAPLADAPGGGAADGGGAPPPPAAAAAAVAAATATAAAATAPTAPAVTLIIKNPGGRGARPPLRLQMPLADTTVGGVKRALTDLVPGAPAVGAQRLIFAGHLLKNGQGTFGGGGGGACAGVAPVWGRARRGEARGRWRAGARVGVGC